MPVYLYKMISTEPKRRTKTMLDINNLPERAIITNIDGDEHTSRLIGWSGKIRRVWSDPNNDIEMECDFGQIMLKLSDIEEL